MADPKFDDPFDTKPGDEKGETPKETDKYSPELISYAHKVMATRARLKKRRKNYVPDEESEGKIARRSKKRGRRHKKFAFRMISFCIAAALGILSGYASTYITDNSRVPVYVGFLSYLLFQAVFIALFKAEHRPDDTIWDTMKKYWRRRY